MSCNCLKIRLSLQEARRFVSASLDQILSFRVPCLERLIPSLTPWQGVFGQPWRPHRWSQVCLILGPSKVGLVSFWFPFEAILQKWDTLEKEEPHPQGWSETAGMPMPLAVGIFLLHLGRSFGQLRGNRGLIQSGNASHGPLQQYVPQTGRR